MIEQLPALQREILDLRFYHSLSYAEMAEALEVPIGTVRSRLHNAISLIRKRIEEDEAGSPENFLSLYLPSTDFFIMNSESLEALVLDRSFGELSPEAEELLAAYLELHPEAMREVEKIEASLSITKAAVTARSDLFSERLFSEEVREQEATGADRSSKDFATTEFPEEALRAVAAVVVVMGVAVAGYMVGNHDAESGNWSLSEAFPAKGSLQGNQPSRWAMPLLCLGPSIDCQPPVWRL